MSDMAIIFSKVLYRKDVSTWKVVVQIFALIKQRVLVGYAFKANTSESMGFESDVEALFTKTCTETVCFYQENVLWSEFTEQRKRQFITTCSHELPM